MTNKKLNYTWTGYSKPTKAFFANVTSRGYIVNLATSAKWRFCRPGSFAHRDHVRGRLGNKRTWLDL